MLYVVTKENEIKILSRVCRCEECKKRKEPEFILNDFNGNYDQHIKSRELREFYFTDSLDKAKQRCLSNIESLNCLNTYFIEILLQKNE